MTVDKNAVKRKVREVADDLEELAKDADDISDFLGEGTEEPDQPGELPARLRVKNISGRTLFMESGRFDAGASGWVTRAEYQNLSQFFERL
jgi:hypothetical protein